MELKYDAAVLLQKLKLTPSQHQLAFGAACCVRLLPNYSAFVKETGWGKLEPLTQALDLIWNHLGGRACSAEDLKTLTQLCEENIPESDDFTSDYVSFAQDACFSICGLLDFLLDPDTCKIVEVGAYATDSVDLYVQEIENMDSRAPDLERRILHHRLMQRELAKQREDLEIIARTSDLDAAFLAQLKNSWGNNGRSNIDLI